MTDSTPPELAELILAFRSGEAGTEELQKLREALRTGPAARELFLRHLYLEALLRQSAQAGPLAENATALTLPAGRRRFGTGVAGVLLRGLTVLGLAWWNWSAPAGHPVAGVVQHLAGEVEIESGGRRFPATRGTELHWGDRLVTRASSPTSEEASSVMIQLRDGAQVILGGDSSLTFQAGPRPQLAVQHGLLSISVEARSEPLLIETIQARIRIPLTEADVLILASPGGTDVSVTQGHLEVDDHRGQSVVVSGGEKAVAQNAGPLAVEDIQPPGETWEVDFERGLPADWFGAFAGEGLPEGSRGAARTRYSPEYDGCLVLGCRAAQPEGLFILRQSSHIHVRLKVDRRDWLNLIIGTRLSTGDEATSRFFRNYKNTDLGDQLPEPGEWRTITIPLSRFHSPDIVLRGDVWAGPAPREGEIPISVSISSTTPDRGLVVDRIWITPDGPGVVTLD